MSRRYFSNEPIEADAVTLRGDEAHHLIHVQRATPGMRVTLFDGSGVEFEAEVAACGRSSVDLTILGRRVIDRELPFTLTLGAALPKGDRQRWLVEKAVELGVTRLVPLHTQRSQATGDRPSAKLPRYVIEASKQCGRNRLMRIDPPRTWQKWLELPAELMPEPSAPVRRWVADPAGEPLTIAAAGEAAPTLIAIGPEGGLSDEELAAAEAAGWRRVGLGPRVLRVETAAVALAAILGAVASPVR